VRSKPSGKLVKDDIEEGGHPEARDSLESISNFEYTSKPLRFLGCRHPLFSPASLMLPPPGPRPGWPYRPAHGYALRLAAHTRAPAPANPPITNANPTVPSEHPRSFAIVRPLSSVTTCPNDDLMDLTPATMRAKLTKSEQRDEHRRSSSRGFSDK